MSFELIDTFRDTKYATHDVGRDSRKRHPGSGWCLRCGFSNQEYVSHSLFFEERQAMSPCCKQCWNKSSVEERLKYAEALFRSWLVGYLHAAWSKYVMMPWNDPELQAIQKAVVEEESPVK